MDKEVDAFEDLFREIEDHSLIDDPRFLDDEQLIRTEQLELLGAVFNNNVRDVELKHLTQHFRPMFRDCHPIHLVIWGKTGTGKTLTVAYFIQMMMELSKRKQIPIRYTYLDLATPKSCFRALNDLACLLNASRRYKKGTSLEAMMGSIEDSLANYHGYFVLSVDEVNHVRTEWDVFSPFLIWRLPQAIPSKLVLVMTSNRIDWTSNLNPRVRSFLRADEILFRPYNALDIQQILKIRTRRALRPNALQAGVIEKISALASREHGDARKAVTLLARAARLAERSGSKITLKLVDQAGSDLEQDRYILMMRTSPVQLQATMAGVVDAWTNRKKASLNTGDVYDAHPRQIARHRHARSVSLLDGPKVRP